MKSSTARESEDLKDVSQQAATSIQNQSGSHLLLITSERNRYLVPFEVVVIIHSILEVFLKRISVSDWIRHCVIINMCLYWKMIKEWWEKWNILLVAVLSPALNFIFSPALACVQTHPLTLFTSFLIFSTAKSQVIQALHRGNQIPAQAWQTTSKFWKMTTIYSRHILCFSSNSYLLSWFLICAPLNSTEIFLYSTYLCARTHNPSAHLQALWAQKHTFGQSNLVWTQK